MMTLDFRQFWCALSFLRIEKWTVNHDKRAGEFDASFACRDFNFS